VSQKARATAVVDVGHGQRARGMPMGMEKLFGGFKELNLPPEPLFSQDRLQRGPILPPFQEDVDSISQSLPPVWDRSLPAAELGGASQ